MNKLLDRVFGYFYDSSDDKKIHDKMDKTIDKTLIQLRVQRKQIECLKSYIVRIATTSEAIFIFKELEEIEKRENNEQS